MYESPIQITERIVTDGIKEIGRQRDEAVYQVVCECGITVDKEKLLEALNCSHKYYTRGYDDGFRDGAEKAIKEFAERLKAELTGWETDPTDEKIEFTIEQSAKEMGVEL